MFKTIVGVAVLVLTLTACWYFAIKKYDYSITFQTHTTAGETYQKLLYYKTGDAQELEIIEKQPFSKIIQNGKFLNVPVRLTWQFLKKNDTLSIVQIGVNHLQQPFRERIKVLFGPTPTQREVAHTLSQFQNSLLRDAAFYEVKIIGKTTTPMETCACIDLENEVDKKAFDMMSQIHVLSDYIRNNALEMTARPRIQVNRWDLKTNRISYDFCFPVKAGSIGKPHPWIVLKNFQGREALKAIYKGNYMSSHLAWIRLLDYAEKNNLQTVQEPLEIFQDNPEMGGDAREWETAIYLPLK